ncbi:hypothetical protein PLESTB_001941600 [Pleodorina starrii]|uniref:Uncharacterized protein n=1 Tax=Pleodorina starrii TaxID=330485 RepID=A0A9W6FC34_9CHLO|nr:hypothetical protein PLESTM_001925800 [Pleodorina starrii]GLC62806.1 hypothetical protein PLESTB_001941600 [Pleodorina starrii]GLC77477.1 hypothetical protein PLESTF_001940000 [Pleodorina starrii]
MVNATGRDLIILYFGEMPNQDAAIAALVLYLAVSIVILVLTTKTRAWFMLTVVLTGLLEAAGFMARVVMIRTPSSMAFIAMQCFLIISPVLLAIVEYICLGKLVAMSRAGRESRLMRWQSRLFAASDVLCLMLQGSAGGMLASDNLDTFNFGRKLMLVGLALQLGFFSMFTCLCIHVQRSGAYGMRGLAPARHIFVTLYATIALMFGRNIFRVAEFTEGYHGKLATNEDYFYGFDFALIFSCFLLFAAQHYGIYLARVRAELDPAIAASGGAGAGGPVPVQARTEVQCFEVVVASRAEQRSQQSSKQGSAGSSSQQGTRQGLPLLGNTVQIAQDVKVVGGWGQ